MAQLAARLPGYLLPRLVRETPGAPAKTLIAPAWLGCCFTAQRPANARISKPENFLNDTTAVPLIVHSATRDPVEALNGLLRRTGMAAHCTWIPSAQDLPEALEQINPELLICYPSAAEELQAVAAVRDQVSQYRAAGRRCAIRSMSSASPRTWRRARATPCHCGSLRGCRR